VWQRLSTRGGNTEPDGPFEGVPEHLAAPLVEWIQDQFRVAFGMENTTLLRQLAVLLRVPKRPGGSDGDLLQQMLNMGLQDPEFCLDMVDALLKFGRLHSSVISQLETTLAIGGSVWTTSTDKRSLTRVVDAAAHDQAQVALSANDRASNELAEAWSNAFGRNPNPSDAWDHAIKAVEEALKPIVTPTNPGATLGNILGDLRSRSAQFTSILQDNGLRSTVDPIGAIESILHLIWPNPDRHGGADKRTPSLSEAQAVVHLAITVVQWARGGVIALR
jgi:hypothetical protein